ncbi:DNA-binding transcriptional LysR family regulator [Rhizobium aquaticum]|uniref:DNA-binding transcriptional LysR family regulator n=1 Tax=Rhizobium aquaticum TaxID=1549636 RepID=A0ABV2J3B2_9HYPH
MTFEQLSIFVAVAERQHLTKAAEALRLTPSAVSAAIKTLEGFYNVQLFHRVGRGIELTEAGRVFLDEAKAVLSRAQSAALVLSELGAMRRGRLAIHASQTVATYWLPQRLVQFHAAYPGIALDLTVSNTQGVTRAVLEGTADIGFIEGRFDEPALAARVVGEDELVVVVAPGHPLARAEGASADTLVSETVWVIREEGSGTRSEFEAMLHAMGFDPNRRKIALTLPSNEAMLSAVRTSLAACAVSRRAVEPLLAQGDLVAVNFPRPERQFRMIRHKERHFGEAAKALEAICLQA